MTTRRRLVLATVAAVLATPIATRSQQRVVGLRRIGSLSPTTVAASRSTNEALLQGLRDLGWIEGQNIVVECWYADGKIDRLPALAAELVRANVDVIVAGSTPAILAAKKATNSTSIVMVTTGDPVADGLISSLAHPGGNVTGVTVLSLDLTAKHLQLLKEVVPKVSRVAVLGGAAYSLKDFASGKAGRAARELGITLITFEARIPSDLESAFTMMAKERANGLLVLPSPMLDSERPRIAALALQHRLPSTYELGGYVEVGGLMFYGATLPYMYRYAASYVDKVLRGAKPADLPVEQPTKFDLVINLKTAKTLGLTIPQSILVRADRVIE